MLLTNHRQIESIPGRLITLTKVSPHVGDNTKAHKLRSKLQQNTGAENSRNTSIIIQPLGLSSQIQPVGLKISRILLGLLIMRNNGLIIRTLVGILVSLSSVRSKDWWQ
jgi:hypothetical protein